MISSNAPVKVLADAMEDQNLSEFLGVGVHVAVLTWSMQATNNLLQEIAEISHLLGRMHFMRSYFKTGEGCNVATKGAIDPKTLWKYVWPTIHALSDFESAVVSSHFAFISMTHRARFTFSATLFLRTGKSRVGTLI